MASRPLSLGWCLTLGALIVGMAGCNCGGEPPLPPNPPAKDLPDAARSKVEVNRTASVLANGKDSVTVTVTVVKADGAALADRTVTLEVTGGGTTLSPASEKTNAEGVLTATLVSTTAGSKRVTASVEAEGGLVVLGSRPTIDFVAPPATQLAFTATSLQGMAGAPLSPVVEVVLRDADGNRAYGSTAAVTVALAAGPASAQLEGTLTVNAVDGVARFSDLTLKRAGTGYSLRATSGSLTPATSPTFDVVPAAPSVLTLTGLPGSMTAGGTADVQVSLADAFGNLATNYRGTLHFTSTDSSAVLPADAAFTAADAGQKSFTGLSLRRAGSQRVTLTDTAVAALTASADVQVVAGAAARLAFRQQPGNQSVRAPLATVQVEITDEFGNVTAINAPPVTVTLSPANGLGGTTTVAPVDGVASFTTLNIAQEHIGYTLTASAAGLVGATSAAFNIVDDVPPAKPVLVQGTTNPTSIVVQWSAVGDDGTLGTAASQELRYSTTNIVTDADFNAATVVATGAPQAAGTAESATLSGLTPGTSYYVALKVTDNSNNSVRSATLPVSTTNPQVAQLAFITQPVDGTAGTAMADVRVALQDASGDTVTTDNSSAVTLNLLNGPAFTPVTVNAVNGVATFSGIRIDTAGMGYRFQATSGSLPAVQSNVFAIRPGPVASLKLVGLVTPVTSGNPGSLDVTAMDAFGNTATSYTGTVHFTSTDPSATLPADYTFTAGDAGQKSFTGVVLRTAGSRTVTVTDTVTASLTDSLTVNVVSGAATQLVLSAPATPVTAGSAFPVQVTLRDSAGNLATGYTGTVHFTSTDGAAVLPADYTFTAGDAGQKTFSTVELRTAGSRSLTVVDTVTAALTDTQSVTVNPGAAASMALSAPASATAGNGFSVTVTVRDAFNNVASGYTGTVSFGSSDAQAALPGSYTFTAGDAGSRLFNVTLRTAGSQSLSVTDGTLNASANISVNPGTAASLTLSGLAASVTAGASNTVQVTLRDSAGNLATGYTGTVHFTSTDGAAVLPADYTFTAGDAGQKTFSSVQLRTAGTHSVTVTDTVTAALTDTQSTTVNAAAAASMALSAPASATAGSGFNVTVTVRDAFNNVASGYTGTVSFSSGDAQATLPGSYTFTAGDAGSHPFSVTLRTAGSQSLSVTDGTLSANANVSVTPAAAASMALSAPASATAGSGFNVTVTVRDAFNNVASGYTGAVSFSSSDAQAALPGSYTFTAGDAGSHQFNVTLRTAGSQSVSVTDGTLSATANVTVNAGAAASLTLTGLPGSVTAGASNTVQVTLRDSAGNIATGYTGRVHFTSTDGAAVLPADYTFTAGDAGQKTFSSVQLRTAGTHSVTVTDTVTATLTDTKSTTVNPAAAASMALSAPASTTAGSGFNVTVTVRDAFNNVASGYTGAVSFSSGDAQATLPGGYTFTVGDAGSHPFSVTLRTAGSQSLSVTDGTLSANANVTVNPGAAASLTLTGLPGSVTAGASNTVQVTLRDSAGNLATGYTGTVHFTSTDGAAVLPADYTFTAGDAGQRTLAGVELRTAGAQSLTVADTGNGALTATAAVTVNPGSPAQLAFSVPPSSGTVRAALSASSVALKDAYGNTTTVSSPTVTVVLTGGNPASTLSGTKTVAPVNGVATFSDLSIDQEGTGFQLSATATGLTSVTSAAFTITDNLAPSAAMISATIISASSVRVQWTAVGDDGSQGQALAHELRYANTPITNDAEFIAATSFSIPPPKAPGGSESVVVTGLNLTVDHYFAVKVHDGAGNSSLSNSPLAVGDACLGYTCTPPPATCSADGRAVVTYTSDCMDSGGVPVCQNTPTSTLCASYETCSAAACVPVTAGSQAGSVIISEFSALGSEFIELRNPTAASIDVHGYTFRNAAGQEVDIRAINDPNGTAGTPVTVAAGEVVYGIPNPSGAIPGTVGFVYGAPGTSFTLADTGDALALYAAPPAGNLQDLVDFRSFVINPDTALTASNFVGFSGSSTQVDPTSLTAAANDTATNWCVSFYGSSGKGSRVTNTAGAANGSCKVAVINELLFDAPGADDARTFVEIAGPGGSVIGGAKITDVEGVTAPTGALNTDGDLGTGETDGEFVIPAGTRIPADGILLVADANPAVTSTTVVGFVPGVDVLAKDVDMENNGGDAVQLVSATGTLLDTLGHDTTGTNWTNNTAYNGLAMYEGGTALTPTTPVGTASPTLVRNTSSTDSDNNRNDFRADPTPTPGAPNDAIVFTIASLTPDDGPATAGATGIAVVGTDISPGLRAQFGSNPSAPCTVSSPTSASCGAIANVSNAVGQVNVIFSNPASVGSTNVTLSNGFTYTASENETNSALEADFCNLQSPSSFTVTRNTTTSLLFGRIYEAGVTNIPGAPAGIVAEVGYGTNGSDPRTSNTWRFFPTAYNMQFGNDDEFMGTFTAPNVGGSTNFSYTFRFSQDGTGLRWTYCDLNGAGSDPGMTFEATQLGVMTVTP